MKEQQLDKLWDWLEQKKLDMPDVLQSIQYNLRFVLCRNRNTTRMHDIYTSIALSVREKLLDNWNQTQKQYFDGEYKKIYYLSLEYLIGRSLKNHLINLGLYEDYRKTLETFDIDLSELLEEEEDAGLGNGGLGRLAACFLDSMTTLQLPAYGYGIRYEYGIFTQEIKDGEQIEHPDTWLSKGYPWEIPRHGLGVKVKFYGRVEEGGNIKGTSCSRWVDTQDVIAIPYDLPISGYGTSTVNNLRLWSAKASKDFDFDLFNAGDFMKAVEQKQQTETISKVLYPNDTGFMGKELRLKQQYFFVSASLQDILRRYRAKYSSFDKIGDHIAIQLNDTHPAIAVPEFMRLMIDEEGLSWQKAWSLTQSVFAYTNHTIMSEALEKWSVNLLGNLLPRLMQIIFDINHFFILELQKTYPNDDQIIKQLSLIEESEEQQVRMAHLAIIGSHTVNGVSALHTELLKQTIFSEFHKMNPKKIQNKTNGITPRLWLKEANPSLSQLIDSKIGNSWTLKLSDLAQLEKFADDEDFQQSWKQVKKENKKALAKYLKGRHGLVDPNTMFDVQVKRIHEYKRQLLNILHAIIVYNRIKNNPSEKRTPRTVMIGGKAAPGYYMAKLIIHLANDVGKRLNADPLSKDLLNFIFLENYNVSFAEKIIPATEISQQISTAGTEASGTSNMKFCLNGAMLLGTMDGANIEITEEIGRENIFIFGMEESEVTSLRNQGYRSKDFINDEVQEALDMIAKGFFNPDEPDRYIDVYNNLVYQDHYMLLADLQSYIDCQQEVESAYQDRKKWLRMSILNVARIGKFSSDRTIDEYARQIWNVRPIQ